MTRTSMPRTGLHMLLLAGLFSLPGCASPADPGYQRLDGARNNPIQVEPAYQTVKLTYYPRGLAESDAAELNAFVDFYREHGNGAISVSAPAGPQARNALNFFAGRISEMGIPRNRILTATHDVLDGDMRVRVNVISYRAYVRPCGDWSQNLSITLDNQTPRNFGCAVQQNMAAMVADPRDLLAPRAGSAEDSARRATVMDNYQKGQPTAAQKTQEQSGALTAIGGGGQ